MAKKDKINVERIGENTGRPITSSPVPVRHALFQDRVPLYLDSNGTIITSTVDRDGTNRQTFSKSNGVPSYGFIINGADSTALRYNNPGDILAYKKFKPGSAEFKRIAEDSKQYNVPLATYGEAFDNFNEVQKQAEQFQAGGSIASRLWNKWTGKDKYVDGYGATRHHVPVRESAHRTALKVADSPLVQAIPVVGDVADGYVAADYAAKGNYKPAIAAIGAGLVLPDVLESGARYIPKGIWRDALKKFDDVGLDVKLDDVTTGVSDDVKKYLDDVKSGKVKITKDINEMTDNEKEALLHQLNSNSSLLSRYGKHRTPSQNYRNTTPVDDDIDKVWIPQETYNDTGDIIDYGTSKQSTEPWWGWDPVEYQQGGEIPKQLLGIQRYGRVQTYPYDKSKKMDKTVREKQPFDVPESWNISSDSPAPMPMYKQDSSGVKPTPMYPEQLNDQIPMHKDNKFMIHQKIYQDGGEIPSNDQQQLFVAIITDMAKTLGVEPSQEFAEAVMTAFENQDDSQGLLTLFTKTKDKFMNETGLFREGGKMIAFVNKFKCGGKAKKACKPKKKQEGGLVPNEETGAGYITTPVNDAKARRQWRERTGGTRAEARTTQNNLAEYLESLGGIAGRSARNSAAAMMGDPQKFAIPSVNPVLKTQPAQINENPQLSGIVPVNQDGGRVFGSEQYPHASRKDAINAAMDQLGFTRAQARLGYKNQKNALRNQGYSGNEMRQAARYNIIDQAYPRATGPELPVLDENIEIDDTPVEINDSFVPLENEPINVKKIDIFGGSFNSAFGAARRSGLDEFTWNGKRYNTKLAPSQSAPLGKAQPIVNKIMTGEGDPAATKRSKSPWVWFPGRPSK